jgi:ATP-dependent Clp protease adaptor protein ClpS
MKHKEIPITKPGFEEIADEKSGEARFLILHNDDFHTFDFVIECLVEVCDMDTVQAEQCTYLVHFKGQCDVKKGSLDFLKPYKEGLTTKGLSATIE